MTNLALIRQVYEEYYRLPPRQRRGSYWVMDAATHARIAVLEFDRQRIYQCSGDGPAFLLGKPIRVQDDVEGFRIVADGAKP